MLPSAQPFKNYEKIKQNVWQVIANSSDYGSQPVISYLTKWGALRFISEQKERLLHEGIEKISPIVMVFVVVN